MEESILNTLRGVIHPIYKKDIVSLDIVKNLKIEEGLIKFHLVFPEVDQESNNIKLECQSLLSTVFPNSEVKIIELVRKENPKKKNINNLDYQQLSNVKKIIAIASGKGGVGKSTITVNLAVALAKLGYKVGVTDADVYGPSIPKMTGTQDYVPEVEIEGNSEIIIPIEKYGVKWMSIGYFASPGQALIWRGAMACNALKQMILQIKWGELDFLLVDLPPGTGDIHITIAKDIPLNGAIIVSTPQEVALADVLKGVNMFRNNDVNIPITGLVENMAWFTPAELPDNKYYIFGHNGGKKMAEELDISLLAQIPIIQSICDSGDKGTPLESNEDIFIDLAKSL